MKFNREEIIERLIDDKTETLTQWALQDQDSLWAYVSDAENFDVLDDDTLATLFEISFGEEIEE